MNILNLYNKVEKLQVTKESEETKREILEILQREVLANGKINKGITSAFKRLVKKEGIVRPVWEQISINNKGNYIFCNGYSLIDFGSSIDNIPVELQANIENVIKEYVKPSISYETLIYQNAINTEISIKDIEILLKYNKTTEHKVLYQLNNVYLDPQLLLDTIICTGNKPKDKINVEIGEPKTPLNISFENCKMGVLPINMSHAKDKNYQDEMFKKLINKECE